MTAVILNNLSLILGFSSLNGVSEKISDEDNRQELSQKVLLSFARQIAVGMVMKHFCIDNFDAHYL